MKIKSTLIALAVSAGIPVTLVAQSPNDFYRGEYLLKISVPGVPWTITASSRYESGGTLKEIDYLPARNFLGIEGQAGYGHWSRTASGQFVIDYKTELPNGQVRQVHALTAVSGSGNELTGTATVKLILGRHQVRTVEREKWLAFLDKVPDVIARLSVLIVVGWATRRAKRIQETTVRLVDRGAALNSLDVLEWHLRVSQSKT